MDYNHTIIEKLPQVIKSIISQVDRFSDTYKIKDIRISVEDTSVDDLGNYISTGTSCDFTLLCEYLLENEEEYRSFELSVPRMIDGIFVILGKYKLIHRKLGDDFECILVGDYFRFNYFLSFRIDEGFFYYRDTMEDEQYKLTFQELTEQFPESLILNEHQGNKLKIMLNLDEAPTKLTDDLAQMIQHVRINKNDIIHKRIVTVENSLLSTLREMKWDIVKALNYNFYKYGSISPTPIQKVITGTFNGTLTEEAAFNTTQNVNPLSFDSTNEKIIIEKDDAERLHPGNYDISMADIIDPLATPDNASINRINMLTKVATMVDGHIGIKCYDKDFNPVEVDLVEYYASRILHHSEVLDYNKRILKDNSIRVILRNRVKTEGKSFDYIEPAPDDRLSVESRMIPMLNEVDSVRGAMAAKMVAQAVPLVAPDEPRVQSGHEGDFENSTTDIKYEGSKEGEVIKADQSSVIVMVDSVPLEYRVPVPAVGMYDITSAFTPVVKVGQKVHAGDNLISHVISRTGKKCLGVNALVALRPYRGYNYEDGIVISESFAKRLSHYSIVDVQLMVREQNAIVEILPIGSIVNSKDRLVTCVQEFRSEINAAFASLMGRDERTRNRYNNLVCPNNIENGIVTDVKIQYNDYAYWDNNDKQHLALNEVSEKIVKKYLDTPVVIPEDLPKEFMTQLPKEVDYEGFAACIRFRILCKNPATPGAKLANRYGSKGLSAIIVPDSEMDKTADGRTIECILNSDAVIARKNIAQIPEVYLSIIADTLKGKLQKELSEGADIKSIKETLNKFGLDQYAEMQNDKLKEYILSDKPLNYITGCFSRFSTDTILKWIDDLQTDALTSIIDGKTGRPVRNKILVGSMYMMKLYALPERAAKVHADSDDDPILGKGYTREGEGQSQGALETFSLLASDLEPYLYETRKKYSFKDAENLLISLRVAGVNIRKIGSQDV